MSKRTIQERFEHFDAANPGVYNLFKQFARQMRKAGHTRYSADAIMHHIRWHFGLMGPDHKFKGEYRLNDHFTSRYARKMIAEVPIYTNFFETRDLRSP